MIPLRAALELIPTVPMSVITTPDASVVDGLANIAYKAGVDFGIKKNTICAVLKYKNGVFLSKKGDPRAIGFLFDGVTVTHNRSDFERHWRNND